MMARFRGAVCFCALAAVLTMLTLVVVPGRSEAAIPQCVSPSHLDYYPGQALGAKVRYGQVGINITACKQQAPFDWSVDVSTSVNAVGKAGFQDVKAELVNGPITPQARDFTVHVKLDECPGWGNLTLCWTKAQWDVHIHVAYVLSGVLANVEVTGGNPVWALHSTP